MKIKAGELMNMRTRAEKARLNLLSAKPCDASKALNALHISEETQDDAADALQEYEDLLTMLINVAEVVL